MLNSSDSLLISVHLAVMLKSNFPVQLIQMGQVQHRFVCSRFFVLAQYTDAPAASETCGAPFFLQIPSVEKWSYASVQFTPFGDPYSSSEADRWTYFVRIYTTGYGVGRIQVNNVNVTAMLYMRIAPSDFYYYDMRTTRYADSYRILTFDTNVTFSVS